MRVLQEKVAAEDRRIGELEDAVEKHDERLGNLNVKLANHELRITNAEEGIRSNNALIWKVIAAIMTAGTTAVSAVHFGQNFFGK